MVVRIVGLTLFVGAGIAYVVVFNHLSKYASKSPATWQLWFPLLPGSLNAEGEKVLRWAWPLLGLCAFFALLGLSMVVSTFVDT